MVLVRCCVTGCKNLGGSRHRFPNPKQNLNLFNKWKLIISNKQLKKLSNGKIYQNCRVCRNHFEDTCFSPGTKRLNRNAYPTLHIPELIEDEENFEINDSKSTEYENIEIDNDLDQFLEDKKKLVPGVSAAITADKLQKWSKSFYGSKKNVLSQNICTKMDPFEVCLSRSVLECTNHVFKYKVETEGKPVTNQKSSGRCWLFATLNCIRIPFIKMYNLDDFEFSQSYLFYWDKIERCNYFLNNIVKTAERGEEVEGRLVSFLLNDPICDGGQWDMVVNLITKYGLMPKKCFPESYSSETSIRMNTILKSKLREFSKILRDLYAKKVGDFELTNEIDKMMEDIYRIVGICLGIPPKVFKWEYYDKSKNYNSIGPISPLEFYNEYIKISFNVEDKVCIVHDPRPTSQYSQAYTVDCLGNVVGARIVLYNNQPIDMLLNLVTLSLKKGESVWFGCEVNKRFASKQGIEDLQVHDFNLVFDTNIQIELCKADRLIYSDSAMTHAMIFTGVSVDESENPIKFRVENSWGEDRGEKGYLIMMKDWFKEFVFEIVVDKSIVPPEVLEVFNQKPIVLPAWDPLGALAK